MHNKRLKNEQIRDKWGRNVYYNKEENKIYAFYENMIYIWFSSILFSQ